MKRFLRFPVLLILIAAISACNKEKTSELDGDWLFPIAKGNLSINSLSQFKNLKYHIEIPALSIGQPINIPISSPGLQLAHVGPFPVRITDWLRRVDIDTLSFSGSLANFFPIPIGAGTVVTMRNTRDTGTANIVGTAVVPATIAPGATFSFNIDVYNKSLSDSVYFFLDNFISPPYNNVIFTITPTQLDITLKVITASLVQIYTGKTFSSIDTSEFSAGDDDNINTRTGGTLSDTAASGFINVFTDNGLPSNVLGQLYFLNEARSQILDSLFVSNLDIGGGSTDAAGNTTFTNSKFTRVAVTRRKLDNLKLSKYVVSRFLFNTVGYPGLFVTANKGAKLSIQFTGDLNLRIQF